MRPLGRFLAAILITLAAAPGGAAERQLSRDAVLGLLDAAAARDEEHPCLRHAVTALGIAYWGIQDELITRCALDIREQALGTEHPLLTGWLANVAAAYRAQKRFAEAAGLLERAVALEARAPEVKDARASSKLETLGWTYWSDGRYADAEETLRRWLALLEETKPRPPDFVFARTYYFLASSQHGLGRLAEAERFYRRAITMVERGPPSNLDVMEYLCDLGGLLAERGRPVEARALAARVRSILDKRNAPAWQRTQVESILRGSAVAGAQSPALSAPRIRAMIAGPSRIGPPPTRETSMSVSACDDIFPQLIEAVERFNGKDHTALVPLLYVDGACAEQAGRRPVAREQFRRALAIREAAFGTDDVRTQASRRVLARLEAQP